MNFKSCVFVEGLCSKKYGTCDRSERE